MNLSTCALQGFQKLHGLVVSDEFVYSKQCPAEIVNLRAQSFSGRERLYTHGYAKIAFFRVVGDAETMTESLQGVDSQQRS